MRCFDSPVELIMVGWAGPESSRSLGLNSGIEEGLVFDERCFEASSIAE